MFDNKDPLHEDKIIRNASRQTDDDSHSCAARSEEQWEQDQYQRADTIKHRHH